jgi:hypothetical protein
MSDLQKGESRNTHRMTSSKEEMSGRLLVNGAATDASASDSDIPISAVFKAGASFAPSPVNPLSPVALITQLKDGDGTNVHCVSQTLETLNQLGFLVRGHSGKDDTFDQHLRPEE